MTGTLAQLVALTAYGNDFLTNGKIEDGFYPNNSTFQFCNSVDFRESKKKYFFFGYKESVIANNPELWFRNLEKTGCTALRLYYRRSEDESLAKDYKIAGFVGGGGVWRIEAIYDNHSEFWADRWEVTDEKATDRKIWSVNYGLIAKQKATVDMNYEPEILKVDFNLTLDRILDFSKKHKLEPWDGIFANSMTVLNDGSPFDNYYHKDLIPHQNYNLVSRQLLAAAGTAWVFGGMGSWNDLGFPDEEVNALYEELSGELFDIINKSIICAVNSF